jgi:aryl-alcohol dehydrogenase-like predicted oxidoreductase
MQERQLGSQGTQASQLGLGCMGMSEFGSTKRIRYWEENVDAVDVHF